MGESGINAPIRKYVRVTGLRSGRFVEFEFSINDADLTVELILPLRAFEEFCVLQEATVLPPISTVAGEFEQLAWRSKNPGLLRRVVAAAHDAGEGLPPGSRLNQ